MSSPILILFWFYDIELENSENFSELEVDAGQELAHEKDRWRLLVSEAKA